MVESAKAGKRVLDNPLGEALELDDAALDLLGDMFAETAAGIGLNGRAIFARLRAGESMGQALALPAGLKDLLYARAHQWFSIGRHEKAEGLFRTLSLLDGSVADHWLGLGICLRLKRQWEQAHSAFRSAAALRPDWAIPHFHAMESFIRQGDWQSARQSAQAFSERSQSNVPPALQKEAARFQAAIDMRLNHPAAGGPAA